MTAHLWNIYKGKFLYSIVGMTLFYLIKLLSTLNNSQKASWSISGPRKYSGNISGGGNITLVIVMICKPILDHICLHWVLMYAILCFFLFFFEREKECTRRQGGDSIQCRVYTQVWELHTTNYSYIFPSIHLTLSN